MSFGYSVLGFGGHANRSTPLDASLITDGSAPLVELIEFPAPAGSGAFTTNAGGVPTFDVSVAASGGSGSYTFAWTNQETRDDTNVFSVATAGTTNAAQYNTIGILGATPSGGGQIATGIYNLRCTVSDGTDTVVVNHSTTLNAIAL